MIYTNTEDFTVTSVCEKQKKKFLWKESFVVEITRYEYWNCEGKFLNISPGVEILLQREPSESISYGITVNYSYLNLFLTTFFLLINF